MPGATFIEGERVELRTVSEDDIEFIQRGTSHPLVRKYVGFGPRTEGNVRQWYEETVVNSDSIVLLIVPTEGEYAGKPIGSISASPINARRSIGNVGIWLLPEAQLRSFAQDAGLHFIDYLFSDYGLRRLSTETFETNRRVRRFMERFDFEEEGRRREAVYFDGEWIDVIEYGLLRSEYPGYDEWKSSALLYDAH